MAKKKEKRADVETAEEDSEAQAEVVEQAEEVEVVQEAVAEAAAVEEKPEGAREEPEKLQEELEKASALAAEYLDGWQRAQAEFANYKKRQETERAQVITLANAVLLRKLLPIVDNFERAIATLPVDLNQLTWCQGIFLIKHKLDAILESEGVKPIETEGQTFDPRHHDAVTYEEVQGHDDGQIVGEVQRGYMLGERVLRSALVRVAKAPAAQSEEGSDTTENKE